MTSDTTGVSHAEGSIPSALSHAIACLPQDDPIVAKGFRALSQREQYIVASRMPPEGIRPKTLRALGTELGVTPERIRKIQIIALSKMRRAIYSD